MKTKTFLFLFALILLTPLISANTFGYNYLNNHPTGNITYQNNTYINQTLELNTTQFETGEPATIKTSWLAGFFEGIVESYNYLTEAQADTLYCKLTGCTMEGNINLNSYNITNVSYLNNKNVSQIVTGNMSSETTYQNISESVSGYSLSFDGVNDYVLTNNVIPINDGNFTIGLWFKTISSSNKFMIDNGDTSSPSNYLSRVLIGIHSDYKIRFYAINENSSDFNIYSPNTYNDGNWHLAVFTKSSNNFTGYVDGVNVGSATKEGNFGNRVFVIGRSQIPRDTTRYFNGSIDEVLIFNRSLNSTEVEQIYNSGVGLYANTSIAPFNEGLVSGWHFDEGTGTTAFDLTGRNNGTLTNGPTYTTGKVNHTETTTIEVLGAIGLMPWVSATNFISTDFSLQWIGNTLKNPWFNSTELGNSTNRFNGHFWNVTAESIYVEGNISAESFNERTSIYDKSLGSALKFSKDADNLLTKNAIDHKQFYGYVEFEVTDYSKPVKEKVSQEVCNAFGCSIEETEIIIYPYTKIEEGVNLGKEIAVLRQQVYELKQQNEFLQEQINNLTGKDTKIEEANTRQDKALCSIKLFDWCLVK